MIAHSDLSDTQLRMLIKNKSIAAGGNRVLKIYGTLHCTSGKRMKRQNRVFFATEQEAAQLGYRPCGHCMKIAYKNRKMNLFNNEQEQNLLPYDGTVVYYGQIMSTQDADAQLHSLLSEITWKNDEAIIFGKHLVTKRKVAWYGDKEFEYTYSNRTKRALPWTGTLLALKSCIEKISGATYNSCLLNLYHDGSESMAWHSDAEKDLKKNAPIASLSFGAARKFAFKHKQSKETLSIVLPHGSLLVMKDETQTHWLHRLPPSRLVTQPRVNLTFRTITH